MKILLFGATGSIGTQLLEVIKPHQLVGISFNNNIPLAHKIIQEHHLQYYWCHSNEKYCSVDSVDELIELTKPDLIVNAIVGVAGLEVSIKAIEHHKDLALANKESLVVAGKFITSLAKKHQVNIYPIDSEHSALYALIKNQPTNIEQLIITCSGGSTYFKTQEELKTISYQEVIKHPNWSMGEKISIDSATLINKCFEIVEAYWLFGIKNIKAVLHPQSIVHAMILKKDHSLNMYASYPDMKLPIKLAINKYQDIEVDIKPLAFHNLNLTFDEIDMNQHLPIKWAYDIINDKNGSLGLIINVANEIAITMFKTNKIAFNEIIPLINEYIKLYQHEKIKNIDDIFYLLDKIIESNYEQIIQNLRNHKNN